MIVNVLLWNRLVGSLTWDEHIGTTVFAYSKQFLNSGIEISPFLMPVNETIYSFENLNAQTYKHLPPVFADSLPDDFGNTIMNAWLSKQGKSIASLLPQERLSYIGKRGIGALEYEPVLYQTKERKEDVHLHELVAIANAVLASKETEQYAKLDEDSLTSILQIGTSAGGARPKAILAYDEDNGIYKPGDLLYGPNHSYWLLKIDGATQKSLGDPEGFGRIEYAYYQMAVDSGIIMSESKLIHEHNRAHFITKRFDRTDNGEKLHKQTINGFAGMDYSKPGMYSYEQIFSIIRQLQLPHKDLEQLYTRMVFNVLARNQDDHTKNFALLMDNTGKWSLAPAYDVCYSYNPSGIWTNKHNLSINGKTDNFTSDDLIKVGKENNIRQSKAIITKVSEVVGNWHKYAKDADVNRDLIVEIGNNHRLGLSK